MTPTETFTRKAPGICDRLLGDFPIRPDDAFAIVGNAGHESLGFTALQEITPVVKGSRGGWGWMQWTGPRRREFEAYCKRNKLDPSSDQANYSWLFIELNSTEKRAIGATVAASGLEEKVVAFEKSFLRAGIKHYPSRQNWARIAEKAAVRLRPEPVPPETKVAILEDEAKAANDRAIRNGTGAVSGAGGEVILVSNAERVADLVTLGLGAAFFVLMVFLGWKAFGHWRKSRDLKKAAILIGDAS
ncbi:hypothetical protein SAMN02983003_3157 [Devosia enhydra]|uniref:Phage tail lysozyme domain-containing protein n=1 Tax=Devosia enhydra TaxID=665118 RepID=A0A1K2I0Y2_9HYPH|nr:phage tail tip lysozyme [Devosia enhydra]SFZ85985.1 hypothetical protein SAMN02983003_3157 [Devosia enhydra]